jgi:ABC-type sugar transport system permease subunit
VADAAEKLAPTCTEGQVVRILPGRSWPTSKRKLLSSAIGIIFVFPAAAYFIMWVFYPAGYGLWLSLTNYSFFVPGYKFVGLANFRTLFGESTWWSAVTVTALYLLEVVPATLLLSFIAAFLIHRLRRGASFFATLFFLPYVIPTVASAVVFELLFQPGGLFNEFLHLHPPWLTEQQYAIPAVSMATAWTLFGFYVVIFLAGFQSIPSEVLDAGSVDGCGSLRSVWSIQIPLLRPIILFCSVTAVAYVMTNFGTIYVMTQGGPGTDTTTLPIDIYNTTFLFSEPSIAEAMALVLLAVTAVLTVIQFTLLGRDIKK